MVSLPTQEEQLELLVVAYVKPNEIDVPNLLGYHFLFQKC